MQPWKGRSCAPSIKPRAAPSPAAGAEGSYTFTATMNDLFVLFPDLPWHRHRGVNRQADDVKRQVRESQLRASENVQRQRAATERVRAAIAARKVRSLKLEAPHQCVVTDPPHDRGSPVSIPRLNHSTRCADDP